MKHKATIKPGEFRSGAMLQGVTRTLQAVTISRGRIVNPVSLYIKEGPKGDSRTRATVVIQAPGMYRIGSGWADGYGYHKASAAAEEAFNAAGVTVLPHIDGCGDVAIERALAAIVRALGYSGEVTIL